MAIISTVFHGGRHLDEVEFLSPDPRCPICAGENRKPVYRLQKSPDVFLLSCDDCKGISASRMPTPAALTDYYSTYYASDIQTDGDQITFEKPIRFARHLAGTYGRFNKDERVSILDFGGGDGTIASLVASELLAQTAREVTITVVDYTERLAPAPDPRITICRASTLEEVNGKFTFIIASAVLEHHPRPRTILAELFERLEPGGIFYARTPYMLPLIKLAAVLGVTVDFTFPAHLHDLGRSFWERQFSNGRHLLIRSRPSIVETTFQAHFLRTLAAYSLKAPSYVLGNLYTLVGGWEVFVQGGGPL